MKKIRKYFFVVVIIFLMFVGLRTIGKSELFFSGGDEARHFMNGVFLRDFVVDKAWRAPLDYLKFYFVKYPALSFHRYPPLFALLEAIVIFIFGVYVIPIQILILVIVCCGLLCWYNYVSEIEGIEVALLSTIFFISSNLFFKYSPRILLGIPGLSFIFIFLYFFEHPQRTNTKRLYCLTYIALASVLLMSYKAFFIILYILLVFIYRTLQNKLSTKRLLAVLGTSFTCIFVCFFTIGSISQAGYAPFLLGSFRGYEMMSFFTWRELFLKHRLFELFTKLECLESFGIPLTLLSLLGIVFIFKNRTWKKISGLLFYAASFWLIYIFCLNHFEERFNIFILPFLCFLSAYGVNCVIKKFQAMKYYTLFVVIIVVCMVSIFLRPVANFRGYEKAAETLVSLNPDALPIFCDAFHEGSFVAYIRKNDPLKRHMVLRGDKLLFSPKFLYPHDIKEIYIHNKQDILDLLNKLGIRYILVDSKNLDIPPKRLLRKLLQDKQKFQFLKTFDVSANNPNPSQYNLELYVYLDYKKEPSEEITMYIPTIGRTVIFNPKRANDFFRERERGQVSS